LLLNNETRDGQLLYVSKKAEQKEQTISISGSSYCNSLLRQLLAHLKSVGNNHPLELVLMSHTTERTDHVANIHHEELSDIGAKNPNIDQVNLIACNIVQAKKTEEEMLMTGKFQRKMEERGQHKYGLMSSHEASIENEVFRQKCIDFCEKNNLEGVYVLNEKKAEDKGNHSYSLISIKYDKTTKSITTKERVVHPDNMQNNQFLDKIIPFPKKANVVLPLKGEKNRVLTIKEITALRDLPHKEKRFSKNHPHYKKDKLLHHKYGLYQGRRDGLLSRPSVNYQEPSKP
jgi:hypothetical protein